MPCRRCEQTRKALGQMWRRITRRQCAIPGCRNPAVSSLCTQHWRMLPLSLRMRWWEDTDYGRRRPSAELVAETISAMRHTLEGQMRH